MCHYLYWPSLVYTAGLAVFREKNAAALGSFLKLNPALDF